MIVSVLTHLIAFLLLIVKNVIVTGSALFLPPSLLLLMRRREKRPVLEPVVGNLSVKLLGPCGRLGHLSASCMELLAGGCTTARVLVRARCFGFAKSCSSTAACMTGVRCRLSL